MSKNSLVFWGMAIAVSIVANLFSALVDRLFQDDKTPNSDFGVVTAGELNALICTIFSVLCYLAIEVEPFCIFLLCIINELIHFLLKRLGLMPILGKVGWYLVGLPIKTVALVLFLNPLDFLTERLWGQIFLGAATISFFTCFTLFAFRIVFFSKESALLLLASILAMIIFYLNRKCSKK